MRYTVYSIEVSRYFAHLPFHLAQLLNVYELLGVRNMLLLLQEAVHEFCPFLGTVLESCFMNRLALFELEIVNVNSSVVPYLYSFDRKRRRVSMQL